MPKARRGFTLIEIIVVVTIVLSLLGFITSNLLSLQHRSSLSATLATVISDLEETRLQAMTGDQTDAWGVYFSTTSYTIFKGSTYNPSDPANSVFALDPQLQFTDILLPNSLVIFSRGGGEFTGFAPGSDSVTLADASEGASKIITFNRYGTVIQVQ